MVDALPWTLYTAACVRGALAEQDSNGTPISTPPLAAYLPPAPQGGAIIFQGRQLLFAHYDKATSAHVDFALLGREATKGL